MNLESKIEAVLFWKGEPLSFKKISEILGESEDQIKIAISNLEKSLENRGIVILKLEDEVMLGTNKELSDIIEKLTREELIKDLGKAGSETLSIILYKGPISRSEIDYIRGVNSQFIIRNLLIRGLIDKVLNPKDGRSFLYKPTFDLLNYLGIHKIEDLPEYQKIKEELNGSEELTKESVTESQ